MAAITTAPHRRNRWQVAAFAGGAMLAVATVAGIGVRQLRDDGAVTRTVELTTDTQQAVPSAAAHAESVFGVGATPQDITMRTAGAAPSVFLVDSADEAAFLQRFLGDINNLSGQLGQAPPAATVVLITSAADATRVQQEVAFARGWQQSLGLPMTQVLDVRGR
jgi:hypothetical protein